MGAVTTERLRERVETMAADALVEFSGRARGENAEWIRHMSPMVVGYAVATAVTDPNRSECLKRIREEGAAKAYQLGMCGKQASYWAAGMMAVMVAIAAATFIDC